MKYTTNYEMKLPEDTDELDVDVLDENFESIDGMIAKKADIASPTFTGTPKAPTPSASTSSTQIATTAFVQSLISTLTTKVESLAASVASMVDVTYYLLWVNSENYAVCDDFDDYAISYSDYSTDGATTSAILRVESGDELPESISATVFFISWSGDNDDEIYNAQALLYPDGTVYTRGRYLWVYNTGVASNPTWGSWSTDNTSNEWNSTYAKSLFSA